MIDYKDIKKAVNKQLSKTEIEIMSRDVEEGFNRPSFFVELDNVNRSSTVSQIERSLTVRIYYFPSERYNYSIEVLEMQDKLEDLFDLKLKIKSRWLNILDYQSFVNDGVLSCSFDIEFEDGRHSEKNVDEEELRKDYPIEDMEELYFK